nr:MAG TPA: Poxvirus A21 Protein [Caudoviricetes sp.]
MFTLFFSLLYCTKIIIIIVPKVREVYFIYSLIIGSSICSSKRFVCYSLYRAIV